MTAPAKHRPWIIKGHVANRSGRRRKTHGIETIDHVVVERAIAGARPEGITVVEREAAIDRLDSYGLTPSEIALRLGLSVRTIFRRREARRREQDMQ